MTKSPAEAELTMPDGRLITKTTEVTREIESIAGVTADQFRQIAMIAQGEFLRLLNAETKERIEIFRRLFNTEKYNELQKKISEDYSDSAKKCDILLNMINTNVQNIRYEQGSEYAEEAEKAASGAMTVKDIESLAEKLIDRDKAELGRLNHSEKEYSDNMNRLAAVIAKAEETEKKRRLLEANAVNVKKSEAAFAAAENLLKQAEEKRPDIQKYNEHIGEIKATLSSYDELAEKCGERDKIRNEYSTAAAEKAQWEKKLAAVKKQLTAEKNESEQLRGCRENYEKIKALAEKISSESAQLKLLYNECKELQRLEEARDMARKDYIRSADSYEHYHEAYLRINRRFMDAQAGILAQELEDGKPCPVCGSCSHPSPCFSSDTPSAAERDTAETEDKKAMSLWHEKRDYAAKLNGQYDEKADHVNKSCIQFTGCEYGADSAEEIKKQLEEKTASKAASDKELDNLSRLIKRCGEISEHLPVLEKALADYSSSLAEADKKLTEASANLKNTEDNIAAISSRLAFTDKAAALSRISQLEKAVYGIESEISNASENVNRCRNERAALIGEAEILKKQLENSENYDINELNSRKKKIYDELQLIKDGIGKLNIRISGNEAALKNIRQKNADFEKEDSRRRWLFTLDSTANGRLSDNGKIKLETYVQTAYFDRILQKANIRFYTMTGGQYEMIRRTDADNNRSQSGLDIDIKDHCNGSVRSAKTLSGGESFKASLSLALGLSDVIQESAGGIRLDTMFVDEGFGSLDDESLQQAIAVLAGLSEGNRLVGIISHVSELKEKIHRQIKVTKDRHGCSKAVIVTE